MYQCALLPTAFYSIYVSVVYTKVTGCICIIFLGIDIIFGEICDYNNKENKSVLNALILNNIEIVCQKVWSNLLLLLVVNVVSSCIRF